MASLNVTYELVIFLLYQVQSLVQGMYLTKSRTLWQDSAAVIIKLYGHLHLKYMFAYGSIRLFVATALF